jgi:hypothetical protein
MPPTPPSQAAPHACLLEIAALLATGVLRHSTEEHTEKEALEISDKSLELPPTTVLSVHDG